MHRRIHRLKLKPEIAYDDLNGSKYQDKSWRTRQGLSRSDVTVMSSAGRHAAAFFGTDHVLHLVVDASGTLRGFDNVLPVWDQGLVGLAGGIYVET